MIQDLTRGNPASLIVKFALPLLIGNLFQQLYQVSDIIIVGRLISVDALAALGASAPIFFVILLVTLGFTGGDPLLPRSDSVPATKAACAVPLPIR